MKLATDFELAPSGVYTMQANQWREYDMALARLGTKDNPYVHTLESGREWKFHADNIFAEASIAPANSVSDFLAQIEKAKLLYETTILCPLEGHDWVDVSLCDGFNHVNTPFLHESAQIFGCSPDYYNGRIRRATAVPRSVRHSPVKEAGFHLHIDLRPDVRGDFDYLHSVANELAEALAPWHRWNCETRHPYYRLRGLFRPTMYGIEYRALGAGVMRYSDDLYNIASTCFAFMREHFNTQEVHI